MQRRRLRILLVILGLALAALLICAALLRGAGSWLVREDPLQKSEVIVVLSGRMPLRAVEAARLYRDGWAPLVWITCPAGVSAEMKRLDVPYVSEETYSQLVLIHSGVPAGSTYVFPNEILNTADEVRAILAEMRRQHVARVIVVTSKVHTRRVRALWRRFADPSMKAIVRGAEDDSFDAARWWRSTGDALDVVRELLGLANEKAGLPLQPAK